MKRLWAQMKKMVVFNEHQSITGFYCLDRDPTIPPVPLTLDAVGLFIQMQVGDTMEQDCSCDSKYMLQAMERMAKVFAKPITGSH